MDLLACQSTHRFAVAGTPPLRPADDVEKAERMAAELADAVCVACRPGAASAAAPVGDR